MAKQGSKKQRTDKFSVPIIFLNIVVAITVLFLFPNIDAAENDLPAETQQQVSPAPVQQNTYTVRCPQYDNLSYGVPGKADTIIEREGYSLGYIEKHEQPAWVVYIITAEEVANRVAKRGNNFREDPMIPTGSATPQDYTRSGYDRGHLAPAADMAFSVKTMSESFYMSNMSPQAPQFNRGIWAKLERQIRHFATAEKRIVVVTGPILPKEKTVTIGANAVTVPEYYYKVIYDTSPPEKMIGFILPNRGSRADLRTFVVTVDRVEELTGLDFFSTVPKEKQEQLEKTITIQNWDWIE